MALFLILWFYVYAGLMFGMVSNSVGLFPNLWMFNQVIGWPVFSLIATFRQFKDSNVGWFIRYHLFKATH